MGSRFADPVRACGPRIYGDNGSSNAPRCFCADVCGITPFVRQTGWRDTDGHHADPAGQTSMKGFAIEQFPDHSATSGAQAGDLVPVLIILERLTATKVTRMRAITNRTAATGPSP